MSNRANSNSSDMAESRRWQKTMKLAEDNEEKGYLTPDT